MVIAVSCYCDASLEQDLEGMWGYEKCKMQENPAGKPEDTYDLKQYLFCWKKHAVLKEEWRNTAVASETNPLKCRSEMFVIHLILTWWNWILMQIII